MTSSDFIPKDKPQKITSATVTWQSPSNIALIKYWGKKKHQIPANTSISFTLDHCRSKTRVNFSKKESLENPYFDFYFEGKKNEDFKPKISKFLEQIEYYCPYLKEYHLEIHSENSFPHSSGIASSASGMSALALCIMDFEKILFPQVSEDHFRKKASFLARLGSGSACRSIEGNLVVWGKHAEIKNSTDLFGISYPFEIHENFRNYQDTILLVDKGEKTVSSSVGHNLMHDHPFAKQRFQQANDNLKNLIPILKSGDLKKFIEIVESEALSLHAMMMSSLPYFVLMKPNTLEIINAIWNYRKRTGIPVCFTLDAGANVHVLYPETQQNTVLEFIKNELVAYCQNGQYICDRIGAGASKIEN